MQIQKSERRRKMRMSRAAIHTERNRSASEEMLSQQILFQSGQLKRYGAGIYSKHHFLIRLQQNIENIIRDVLDSFDCIEVSLPILQPKSIWEASGRWDRYVDSGQLFYCETSGSTFCMAPTAEEAVLEFARDSLKSHKDLPANLYQIGPKFRNELRSRGGLLRGKEFTMMDAYSFHSSEDSLKKEYLKMRNAYMQVFKRLGLTTTLPVGALSGDIGGNFSEEFMFPSEEGEDSIFVNSSRTVGFNSEILTMEDSSSYLKNFGITSFEELKKVRAIELGHIFQLGQKYSSSMNATFKDQNNNDIPYYMGCYGIGTSRVLAAICEANCDEEGLCLPENLAPYQLMIIYKYDKESEAFNLYHRLSMSGISVVIDDRKKMSIGAKIKDWKLFGLPYLLIVGDQTTRTNLELEGRKNGFKCGFSFDSLVEFLK